MLLAICFLGLCGAVIIPAITHLFTSQPTGILLDLYLEREHASGNKLSTSQCADSCLIVNPASVLSSAPSVRREPCACYMVTILWRCRLHRVLYIFGVHSKRPPAHWNVRALFWLWVTGEHSAIFALATKYSIVLLIVTDTNQILLLSTRPIIVTHGQQKLS